MGYRLIEGGTCRRGHLLTPENIFHNRSTGHRACRLCRNAKQREYVHKPGRCGNCGGPWRSKKYRTCAKCRRQVRESYRADPQAAREATRRANDRLRQAVLDRYGRACACCGEDHEEFLAIDHIKGGGNKHRKELGVMAGSAFYRWLIKQGLPDGYRTLCHNCNMATRLGGVCPHQKEAA